MKTMDRKRKRVEVIDPSSFSHEEIECAETLVSLSLSNNSSTPSSSSSLSLSPKSEKQQPTTANNKQLRIVIRPPKPPISDNSLPPIESIIDKFTPLDPCFGKKFIVVNKPLTHTDVNPNQTRLGILHSDLNDKVEFLTQQEKDELEKIYPNLDGKKPKKGHVRVKVRGCFSQKEHDMLMSKWYYNSGIGFRYALIGGWNSFKDQHGLKPGDKITIVAVRSQGVLCFVIHGGQSQEPRPADLALVPRQQRKKVKPLPGVFPVAVNNGSVPRPVIARAPVPVAVAAAPAPCLLTRRRTLPKPLKMLIGSM